MKNLTSTEPTAGVTLADIESSTKRFADARETVGGYVSALDQQIEAFKRAAMPDIKRAVARAIERQAELKALLESSPGLFEKPRTQMFHGIKVGFRKGTGGIDWADNEQTVKLIRKHFPDATAEVYIRKTEAPIAKALAELDVATLKKLGCTVEDTGDVVVIKATDSEIEKTVNALLKGAAEEVCSGF